MASNNATGAGSGAFTSGSDYAVGALIGVFATATVGIWLTRRSPVCSPPPPGAGVLSAKSIDAVEWPNAVEGSTGGALQSRFGVCADEGDRRAVQGDRFEPGGCGAWSAGLASRLGPAARARVIGDRCGPVAGKAIRGGHTVYATNRQDACTTVTESATS